MWCGVYGSGEIEKAKRGSLRNGKGVEGEIKRKKGGWKGE